MMSLKKPPLHRDVLEHNKQALIAYLLAKVKVGDWHAVQDAASDIREIDAVLKHLRGEP
jgi:hypothetical protein